jgi:hypothetical protein
MVRKWSTVPISLSYINPQCFILYFPLTLSLTNNRRHVFDLQAPRGGSFTRRPNSPATITHTSPQRTTAHLRPNARHAPSGPPPRATPCSPWTSRAPPPAPPPAPPRTGAASPPDSPRPPPESPPGVRARVLKSRHLESSTQRPKQDGFLKCLQGGQARPLAACRVATRCFSPQALEEPKP